MESNGSVVKLEKYLRFGFCKRCGFCCTSKRCGHFEWKNGEAICKVWGNGSMPEECKSYPISPPILSDDCGYRFVEIKTRRKLEPRQI